MCELLDETSVWGRQFEGPQKVVGLLELRAAREDLVHQGDGQGDEVSQLIRKLYKLESGPRGGPTPEGVCRGARGCSTPPLLPPPLLHIQKLSHDYSVEKSSLSKNVVAGNTISAQ